MGYNTFAIVSAKSAKITVKTISALLIASIGWISYLQITYDELYAAIYVLLSIELPLVYFFIKLRTANDKKTYHQLSQLIKLIMLTGTLSILVFTLLF
jgi:4-hydroxybenzoate polyprenyltransferase